MSEERGGAYISNIQRFCVHDGPGIRSVVFFLGCPLRCKWCQNPEAIAAAPRLMMNRALCARCGACAAACPQGAIRPGADGFPETDRALCDGCFRCVSECFFEARAATGTWYTPEALARSVLKDKAFFVQSGGGVTLSGGEPMRRPDFSLALLRLCGAVHRTVETCGCAPWEAYASLLDDVELFLYDVKLFHADKHKAWTGVSNERILENLRRLAAAGKAIVVRVPLIPDVNDVPAEFAAILAFVRSLETIRALHLLPFHHLGSSKYAQIGRVYEMAGWREENEAGIERCREAALAAGFRVSVGGSGA
jgi:pyruvate formate lyase activating enzyme